MLFADIKNNIEKVRKEDPAALSKFAILLLYPGIHAYIIYRVSNKLHKYNLKLFARLISQIGRFLTGIEIHPRSSNRQ